ncbi:MAG: alanine racemase [Erysipelotrichaceae bacterium]|nr:alanine racemase [Erysipelotrichaceae bacterium]
MNKTRCWVEVNLANLRFNVRNMLEFCNHEIKPIAIVKANGYGHGAVEVTRTMEEEGITDFGVACLDEALELRNAGITGRILILGYVDRSQWQKAVDIDVIMTLASAEHAEDLNSWASERGITVNAELKVDTGMRRIGVDWDCDDDVIRNLFEMSNMHINGIFTHLCCADSFDENDRQFTLEQYRRYDSFISRVKSSGYETGRRHVSASSGFLNYPDHRYDAFRPGFMLYGFNVGEIHDRYETRPVMSFFAKVEYVKTIKNEEAVSYGRIYHANGERQIATVSCGYADGYPRSLTGNAFVLVRGHKVPVVGRICMDQMMIDVTGIDVEREDVVTLIGTDGNETITMEQVSEWAGSIGHEVASRIMPRAKRHYIDERK